MASIYVETTIPSLATSKPSQDIIVAGRQASTILFWEHERHKYELYVSQYVLEECSLGDAEAAGRRLSFLRDIPAIPVSDQILPLANRYQQLLGVPDKARTDCFHLAICVVAEIDIILSWNCKHMGVQTFAKMQNDNIKHALHTPLLLTPEALLDTED